MNSLDRQVGGNHYKELKIQPWEVIDSNGLDFYLGNAIKYILRVGKKEDDVIQLKKAIHYLEHKIEILENYAPGGEIKPSDRCDTTFV